MALDALMERHGWYPTQSNRVSDDLSNGSSAHRWILRSIYRLYVNNSEAKSGDRLVAVHLTFDPPDLYDQPVCLCISAKFPSPTSTQEMWNRWSYPGSERLLEHLGGVDQPKPIPKPFFKGLLPTAEAGGAFAVNLCGLNSEPV